MRKRFSSDNILQKVREAAAPIVASFGLEIWGVELTPVGRTVLRLYVDAPAATQTENGKGTDGVLEGVSVDQCAEISRMLGLALDVEEVFPEAWILEVSSPGFDRVFFEPAQLTVYKGRDINVTLLKPHPDIPGRRKFKGLLKEVNGERFTMEVLLHSSPDTKPESADVFMDWSMVKKVRLVPVFPDTSKPRLGKDTRKSSGKGGSKHA